MPQTLILWLMPACLLLALAGIAAMGWLTGWRRLARCYPCQPAGPGTRLRQARIWFGITRYRNLVVLRTDPTHLHFSVWLRLGHPAFSVPWDQLTAAYETHGFARVLRLRAAAAPEVRVRVSGMAAARLLDASGGRLRVAGVDTDVSSATGGDAKRSLGNPR